MLDGLELHLLLLPVQQPAAGDQQAQGGSQHEDRNCTESSVGFQPLTLDTHASSFLSTGELWLWLLPTHLDCNRLQSSIGVRR
jgi:hypothetical protein